MTKFKVGDIVRLTITNCDQTGAIGVIARIIPEDAWPYKVNLFLHTEHREWVLSRDEIELVNPEDVDT